MSQQGSGTHWSAEEERLLLEVVDYLIDGDRSRDVPWRVARKIAEQKGLLRTRSAMQGYYLKMLKREKQRQEEQVQQQETSPDKPASVLDWMGQVEDRIKRLEGQAEGQVADIEKRFQKLEKGLQETITEFRQAGAHAVQSHQMLASAFDALTAMFAELPAVLAKIRRAVIR